MCVHTRAYLCCACVRVCVCVKAIGYHLGSSLVMPSISFETSFLIYLVLINSTWLAGLEIKTCQHIFVVVVVTKYLAEVTENVRFV